MWRYFKQLSSETKAFSILVALAVIAMLYGWFHEGQQPLSKKEFTAVPPIPSAAKVLLVDIPMKTVKVLKKSDLTKRIQLPSGVADDPVKEVTATASLPPTKGGAEVVTVIDTVTGLSTIIAKEKPLPFLAFLNEKRVGVGYGVNTQGENVGKLYGEWSFVRAGNVYLSLQGNIEQRPLKGPEASAFVTLDYRF